MPMSTLFSRPMILFGSLGLCLTVSACEASLNLERSSAPQASSAATPASTPQSANASGSPAPVQSRAAVNLVQVIPERLVMEVGKSSQGTATVRYADNTSDSDLIWSSSDDTIASVDPRSGQIQALRSGEVTIIATATRDNRQRSALQLSVRPGAAETALVELNPTSMEIKVGGTSTFQAIARRADGTQSGNLSWQSSDTQVFVVSGSGSSANIIGVAPGTATLTVRADGDPSRMASATVTVTAASPVSDNTEE